MPLFGSGYLRLISIILAAVLIPAHHIYPSNPHGHSASVVMKKNVFISRGWGASGMPLSTTATPTGRRGGDPGGFGPGNGITKMWNKNKLRQLLLNKDHNYHRPGIRNYSIPQLFVSYGWGPMG